MFKDVVDFTKKELADCKRRQRALTEEIQRLERMLEAAGESEPEMVTVVLRNRGRPIKDATREVWTKIVSDLLSDGEEHSIVEAAQRVKEQTNTVVNPRHISNFLSAAPLKNREVVRVEGKRGFYKKAS